MIMLFCLSFFVASMLSLTAYLQSDSRWWTGLLGASVLFAVGFVAAVNAPAVEVGDTLPPILILVAGTWLCATIIGAGSISALVLRPFRTAGQVAGIVFLGGWALTFLWSVIRAFT